MSSSMRQEPHPKKRRAGDPHSLLSTNDECVALDKTVLVDGAKAFILQRLRHYDDEDFWDDLPSEWKKDRDVAIEALVGGKTTLDKLPVDLQNDRDFLIAAVNEDSRLWLSLSPAFKDDIDFARSLTNFTSELVLDKIFEKLPILANERNTWLAILASVDQDEQFFGDFYGTFDRHQDEQFFGDFYGTFDRHAPQVIRSDQELMMRACMLRGCILSVIVDESLSRNRGFLRDILTQDPLAIQHFPVESQEMFPELVIEVLPMVLRDFIHDQPVLHFRPAHARHSDISEYFIPELWHNRGFIQAWFQGGGPFLSEMFGQSLKSDREVFLWMAEKFPKDDPTGLVKSFAFASPALRSDKGFMLQAIEHNPNIFHAAHAVLRADFDVFLMAFGGTAGKHPCISKTLWKRLRGVVRQCGLRVEKELRKQETFVKTLLCGISVHQPNTEPTAALALLNQGEATALNYKRLIADYLDVPTGKRLRMLRQASRNLACALSSVAHALQPSP